jgi:SnoaL-like polyketide cyclase
MHPSAWKASSPKFGRDKFYELRVEYLRLAALVVLGFLGEAGYIHQEKGIMSTEENKALVRRLMEESFGGGKPELVDDLLDPDFVRYDPYIEAGEVRGAQTVKENIVWFHNAFSDFGCTIEEQVAEGEKVVSRWTVRGTHQGSSSVLLARAIGWSSRASRSTALTRAAR